MDYRGDFVLGHTELANPVDNWVRTVVMYRNFETPAVRCKEQVTLAEAIVIASGKVQQAQVDFDEAKEAKIDTRASCAMLQSVRREGRQAVVALDEHKQEHQCELPPDRTKTNWASAGRKSDTTAIANYSWLTAKDKTPTPSES